MLTFYNYSYTSSKTYFGNIFYLIILYYELSYLTQKRNNNL